MRHLIRLYEHGKLIKVFPSVHNSRESAKENCRMFVDKCTHRSASVFLINSSQRTDDFFGTEKGYIYNAVI